MGLSLASWFVALLGIYAALGVLFAIPFVVAGVGRIDPAARGGTIGFRLLIVPGVIALWPLLAQRWRRGITAPPAERNPHRAAAESKA